MTRGEKVILFIETFCKVPEGDKVGSLIVLDQFQKDFILDVYDNPHVTELGILCIARKNGKTALIAALLLAHIVGPEAVLNSQIVSGAMSKDQAAIVFKLATKMINFNDELRNLCRVVPSQKIIIGLAMNVEFRALSADSTTAHGLSPILAILDEVGQVKGPQSDFIDAIITADGAYASPLVMVISTQAATDADLLSVWIDDAKTSGDKGIVCHLYTAKADCDLLDENEWKASNPALGSFRSYEKLKKKAEKAARMPSFENTFRNLNLNQRVATTSPFIAKSIWLKNGSEPEPMKDEVWIALDLSAKADLTAMIVVCRSGNFWDIHSYFWTPEKGLLERSKRDRVPYNVWVKQGFLLTTPSATVDYSFVAAQIQKEFSNKIIRGIIFDRWRMDLLKLEFEKIGFDTEGPLDEDNKPTSILKEHGQGYKDMSPSIDTLEGELLNGRLRHGGHPVLTMCAANAVTVKDAAGNRKLEKSKSTGRIDGLVALTMALGKAIASGDYKNDLGNDGTLI